MEKEKLIIYENYQKEDWELNNILSFIDGYLQTNEPRVKRVRSFIYKVSLAQSKKYYFVIRIKTLNNLYIACMKTKHISNFFKEWTKLIKEINPFLFLKTASNIVYISGTKNIDLTREILKLPFFISIHSFKNNKLILDDISPWTCVNLKGTNLNSIEGKSQIKISKNINKRFLITNQQRKKTYKIDPSHKFKIDLFNYLEIKSLVIENNELSKNLY